MRDVFHVFYSVKTAWCKTCIFLVFYSHSQCQRPKMGTRIGLTALNKGCKKHLFSRMFLTGVRKIHFIFTCCPESYLSAAHVKACFLVFYSHLRKTINFLRWTRVQVMVCMQALNYVFSSCFTPFLGSHAVNPRRYFLIFWSNL